MKMIKILLSILAITTSQWAFSAQSLQGVWELEYARYTKNGEQVGEIKDGSVKSFKIVTKKHFSYITSAKDGKFLAAGAGTYTSTKKDYVETVTTSAQADAIGKTYHFTYEIKKGVWIHKGMEDGTFIEEHWRKLE